MRQNFLLAMLFVLTIIFLSSCNPREAIPLGWITFKSDMGLSVSYPTTYKYVSGQGKDIDNSIIIETENKKSSILIYRLNNEHLSETDVIIRMNQGMNLDKEQKLSYQLTKRENYDIYDVIDARAYGHGVTIVSDKGTYIVWENSKIQKDKGLLTEKEYNSQKEIFQKIVDSITIN